MKQLHVASAQLISHGGAAETLPRIDALSQAAACLGAEAILFSEVAIHGYDYDMTPESVRAVAEPIDGPIAQEVLAIARRHNIVVLAGTFEREVEAIYNTHLIAEPSGQLRVQRKHNLTDGELRARLTPGPQDPEVFSINGVRCAVLICADTGIEGIENRCKERGVELRFIPTGGGGKLSDMLSQADLATPENRTRYELNRPAVCLPDAFDPKFPEWGSAFVSANALGRAGETTCHQGHCIIVDNQGVLRAQAVGTIVQEHMHEQLINAVIHFSDR
jgi:predicted amidohydrolase